MQQGISGARGQDAAVFAGADSKIFKWSVETAVCEGSMQLETLDLHGRVSTGLIGALPNTSQTNLGRMQDESSWLH